VAPATVPVARHYHEVVGDIICPSQVRGIDHIRDPRLNKVRKYGKNYITWF